MKLTMLVLTEADRNDYCIHKVVQSIVIFVVLSCGSTGESRPRIL